MHAQESNLLVFAPAIASFSGFEPLQEPKEALFLRYIFVSLLKLLPSVLYSAPQLIGAPDKRFVQVS